MPRTAGRRVDLGGPRLRQRRPAADHARLRLAGRGERGSAVRAAEGGWEGSASSTSRSRAGLDCSPPCPPTAGRTRTPWCPISSTTASCCTSAHTRWPFSPTWRPAASTRTGISAWWRCRSTIRSRPASSPSRTCSTRRSGTCGLARRRSSRTRPAATTSPSSSHGTLAAAACMSEGQIWDLREPQRPMALSHVDLADVSFWHSAAWSNDGSVVAFGDENLEPAGCTDAPLGSIWFYGVDDPAAPRLAGRYSLDRYQGSEICSAHMFNVIPGIDRDLLVAAFYSGGTAVIDFTDPTQPVEVAYFDVGGRTPGRPVGVLLVSRLHLGVGPPARARCLRAGPARCRRRHQPSAPEPADAGIAPVKGTRIPSRRSPLLSACSPRGRPPRNEGDGGQLVAHCPTCWHRRGARVAAPPPGPVSHPFFNEAAPVPSGLGPFDGAARSPLLRPPPPTPPPRAPVPPAPLPVGPPSAPPGPRAC